MARKKGKELDSKAALLDAAWQLLHEHGAGGMSVEAIVTRAGLSKGTFFHFFPAKQDLLDALCARIADESWTHASAELARSDLDPILRLDLFLQASRAWRSERSRAIGGLWQELVRADNAALMNKVRSLSVERLAPPLARLFDEANRRGRMRVHDVEVVARLVVEWLSATVEGSLHLLAERRDASAVELALRRANSMVEAMERVLGAPSRSLTRVDRRIVAKVAAGVPPTKDASAATAATDRRASPGRVKSRPRRSTK